MTRPGRVDRGMPELFTDQLARGTAVVEREEVERRARRVLASPYSTAFGKRLAARVLRLPEPAPVLLEEVVE